MDEDGRQARASGTYELQSITVGPAGAEGVDVPGVRGMLCYSTDGGVWVVLHVPPGQPDGLLSGSYAGTVDHRGDTVTHRVVHGTPPFGPGAELVRGIRLDATGVLDLSGPTPSGSTARLRWRRVH